MNSLIKIIIKNLVSILVAGGGAYFLSGVALTTYFRLSGGCPIDNIGLPADYKAPFHCTPNHTLFQVIVGTFIFIIAYLLIRRVLGGVLNG